MAAIEGHSAACCAIPPINVKTNNPPRGRYETIDGLKIYVTGNPESSKAILFIYDVFGYYPQTVQGADILAYGDEKNEYQVFIPDFLDGNYPDISWYPPPTPEIAANLGEFLSTIASPPAAVSRIPSILKSLERFSPSIKTWGAVGFCWGGKVVSVTTSTIDTPFKAAAECHPAFVDPNEALGIKIPLCMLASGDEPVEDVEKFKENLKVVNHVETFGDMVHGWMTAKGDLGDERKKGEYERGYKVLLEFFGKYL